MCTPQAAIGIASAVVGYMGEQQDYEARTQQWQQNRLNALAAGMEDQKALQIRMIQEQDSESQEAHLTEIEGAEVTAEAEASAANAGVSGVSLTNIMRGISRKIADKRAATITNYRNIAQQLTAEMKATNADIENRINGVQRPTAPSPAGAFLKAAGAGLEGIAEYQEKQKVRAPQKPRVE